MNTQKQVMEIHHIGFISKNIEKDTFIYEQLGYKTIGDLVTDTVQNNYLRFMKNIHDDNLIELICPINENSSVKNAKEGLHHICYQVDDLNKIIDIIQRNKLGTVFTKTIQAPAFNNRKIIFCYLKNKTIIEYLER